MKYKFKTMPMDHQRRAIRELVEHDGVYALLMDPGTGKTKPVIDYLAMLALKYDSCDALIAVPINALDVWVQEFQKHLGYDEKGERVPCELVVLDDRGTIEEKAKAISSLGEIPNEGGIRAVIINHEAFQYRHLVKGLKTVTVRDRMLSAVEKDWSPDVVVVDELHKLKTPSSNTSTAFAHIARHIPKRIGMTGTFAPNSPLDAYGEFQFIDANIFDMSWSEFKQYYAIWGGYENRQVLRYTNLSDLKKKVTSRALVVRKSECLDLPKVTDIMVPVLLTKKEKDIYKKMGKELMVTLPSGKQSISPNTLTKILRLQQITGGVVGYTEAVVENGKSKTVSRTEDIGSSKLRELVNKVEQINGGGHKQVVFAHFRRDIARIVKALKKSKELEDTPVFVITGDTKKNLRAGLRKKFKKHKGPAIFVAQIATISHAVNEFVVASYGHYYSYSRQRDHFIQSRDRLDRKGQKNPVTFYYYVVPHSVDEVIIQSFRDKAKLEGLITKRFKEILTLGEE